MKAQVKQSTVRPSQLLSQTPLQVTDDVRADIGNINTCERDLQCQRRGCLPKDPATLSQLIITDEWMLKEKQRPLLINDTDPGEPYRIVVYAAEEQLRHPGLSDPCYMDGNLWQSYHPCVKGRTGLSLNSSM